MRYENIVIDSKGITTVLCSQIIGKSNIFSIIPNDKAFQIILRGKGNVYAEVNIMASLLPDPETFFILNDREIKLIGVDIDSEGFISDTPWRHFIVDIIKLVGEDASVEVYVGV